MTKTTTETAELHKVVPDLEPLLTAVGKLRLLPGNPRRGDVDAIARSLDRFGQRKPVVARSTDSTVVAGNHTLQAALKLGWSHIAVVWVEDDDMAAKAYALADNRTAELGNYDNAALGAMVSEVYKFDEALLADTGWSPDDLDDILDGTLGDGLDDAEGEGLTKGTLLAKMDVTVKDPKRMPDLGSIWRLGPHTLVVADLMKQHRIWAPLLEDEVIFVPYPGPYVVLAEGINEKRLLLVQPEPYLAGHLLDKYAAVFGDDQVKETSGS